MIKKIHELKQKTQGEKERIAFMGATILTLFIILFWFAGVTALRNLDQNQKAQAGGPVQELKDSFSGIFKK